MTTRANYFKIGLFVLTGAAILVVGIVVLGAGALFKKTVPLETYIDESVQGLDVGSPVKYLGVQIGNVKKIALAEIYYKTEHPYVYVGIDLSADTFAQWGDEKFAERLDMEIKRGLRIRLASQGLTGAAYLELDYHDPERAAPLPIDWKPENYYIPSAPSTITRVTESVDQVFRRLEQTQIEQVVKDLDTFLVTLTEAVKDAKVATVREETVGLIESLRKSAERIQGLIEKPELDSIPGDVAATVASARTIATSAEKDIDGILKDLRNITRDVDRITSELKTLVDSEEMSQGLKDLAATTGNVKTASEDFPETTRQLNDTLRHVDELLLGQQREIEAILANIKALTLNLRELSDDAKRYPSGVLFGEPPQSPEVAK